VKSQICEIEIDFMDYSVACFVDFLTRVLQLDAEGELSLVL